jgi:hypothetical protein
MRHVLKVDYVSYLFRTAVSKDCEVYPNNDISGFCKINKKILQRCCTGAIELIIMPHP